MNSLTQLFALSPLIDRMATFPAFALYDIKSLMNSHPKQLYINPIADPVIGHYPDVITESAATEIINEIMAF